MRQCARGWLWAAIAVGAMAGGRAALANGPSEAPEVIASVPAEYRDGVSQRLNFAGTNRDELIDALNRCPAAHREALAFLIVNMPESDLRTLKANFLLKNVSLAHEAGARHPWSKAVPKEIFLDAVVPYANVNERRDDWREDFVSRFDSMVKDCTTATEAAQLLNRQVFKALGVQYHATRRRKPDQSPYESKDVGYASCTGLSIILADACRAVGVPARVVGTPRWSDDSGNHTWVEFWDGQWWYIGAAEPGALNDTWFSGQAAKADDSHPENRIYAASFRKTDTPFVMIWSSRRDISAVDVSKYYVHRQKLNLSAVDAGGSPISAMFKVIESGRLVGQLEGPAATFEVAAGEDYVVRAEAGVMAAEASVRLPADADVKKEVRLGTKEKAVGSAAGEPHAVAPKAPEIPGEVTGPVLELQRWLGRPRAERGELTSHPFAAAALSKNQSLAAERLLWNDHADRIRVEREAEWNAKEIVAGGKSMKFLSKSFGSKPEGGWNLFISMHGGGNAPPELNDSQWKNQITLYQPKNSLYIAPRAPTNTWNLWHEAHIDDLFDRMIEDAIVLEGVNPDRVYIMGYSAGGDGVYQLAPRMADRLAGAAMMAGHPNDASPLGLRNIAFTIHVGARDNGYDRNKVAEKWKGLLNDLRKDDSKGYVHEVQIHAGRPHWMNHEDAVAVDWLEGFTRNPFPEKVVWKQSSRTHDRFYWLTVPKGQAKAGSLVVATRQGQRIEIEKAEDVKNVGVLLNDRMVNLDRPVTIVVGGKSVFEGKALRTIAGLAATLDGRGDPMSVYPASVNIDIGQKP